ncbi:MAG: flagellar hook protein FlgE [Myxococcota bacterium]
MSVNKSMNTGISGLKAQEQALGVVSDNIANVNTVGFKASRALFEDVLGSTSNTEAGSGARLTRIQQIFTQGSLQNTGVTTDLALSGDGFFVVRGTVDGQEGQFYSRAGQFNFREGNLVNADGLRVQGYAAAPDGGFVTTLSDIEVTASALSPNPTAGIELTANLDANATAPAAPFDIADPGGTSNFSTSITVFDAQGNAQTLDVYFVKTANPNEWDVRIVGESDAVSAPAPATPGDPLVELASGTVTFDGEGRLQTATPLTANVTFGNATPQSIELDLGDPTATGGTGQLGVTQYGAPSSVASQSQDGFASGDLVGVDIAADGTVSGLYSNGESLALAQLAVAKFQSNDGLARRGSNVWAESRDSGAPAIGPAGAGGRAAVVSGAVEQSTVDLTSQFVDMITYQRAFSANARTITTADEMLTEVVNLKR